MAAQQKRRTINLLTEEFRESGKIKEFREKIGRINAVFLVLYIVILLGIAGGLFFFNAQLNEVLGENDLLTQEIEGFKNKEGLLESVKNRAQLAKSAFAQSKNTDERFSILEEVLPSGTGLQIIEAGVEEKGISLVLSSPSAILVSDYLDFLETKDFEVVVLKALTLSKEGAYTVSLQIQ